MTRRLALAAALAVALFPRPSSAQSFYAVVSGEDPNHLIELRGQAWICDYSEDQYMVLTDSATGRAITFLFHNRTQQDRTQYTFGTEDEGADVFVEYVPTVRSQDYTGPGTLTLNALGPQGLHGEFTLRGQSDSGGHAIVTGELTARSLGYLPAGTRCNPQAREQLVRAQGWAPAIVTHVLANEVSVGMSGLMALASWGLPRHTERTTTAQGTTEVWTYPNASLTLLDGKVTVIRD